MNFYPLRRVALATLVLGLAVACDDRSSPTDPSQPTPLGDGTSTQSSSTSSPPPQPVKLTAADLRPELRAWGEAGTLPSEIKIDFAVPAFELDAVNSVASNTVLTIIPEVPGRLVITSAYQLTFTPAKPLAFGTKYAVVLDEVNTKDGVLRPAASGEWRTSFETEKFAFLRMTAKELDYARSRVTLELAFSGPVAPKQANAFLSFMVESEKLTASVAQGSAANLLDVTLTSPRLRPAATVMLGVREGLASSSDRNAKASAANVTLALPGGEPMKIFAAKLEESQDGFYVELICSDDAVGNERYYYDQETGNDYELSSRCVLADEDVARKVTVTPNVPVKAVAGRKGFRLMGDFQRGDLSVRIAAGAMTIDGGVLMEAFDAKLTVPGRTPKVRFLSSGRYLPKSAWRNLPLQHLNVPEVQLSVRQVPPENLVFWLSQHGTEQIDDRTGDLLVSKTIKLQAEPDEQKTTWIDVASMVPPNTRGVLQIIAHKDSAVATSRLLVTDLSLVAKKSATLPNDAHKQEVHVWAFGTESTAPLSGVELQLKRKSGKTVATCSTDGKGACVLKVAQPADADTSEPFAIIARKGDDLTYIRYADLKTATSDFDVQGEPFVSEKAYRAAIWSDRGVYRPGETAHVAAIIRDRQNVAPGAKLPVEVKLTDPREKVVKQLQLETNGAGMLEVSLPFASFADTGRYSVEITAGKKTIGTYAFNVEEFVPERMKVEAKPLQAGYSLGEQARVAVRASYLFGGSAEESRVQLTCRLEPAMFKPKENAQYQYGTWTGDESDSDGSQKPLTLGDVEGTLDDKGQASLECPELENAATFHGAGRLVAAAAVFEAGSGRSTRSEGSAPVHPERFYLGLQSGTDSYDGTTPFSVSGVVVDWNGALLKDALKEVQVELIRLEPEYGYYYDEEEGGERHQRQLRASIDGRRQVPVKDGKFTVDVKPSQGGAAYVVRVKSGKARTDLYLKGDDNWYEWSASQARVDQTPRPLKATSVAVSLPEELVVGEPATVKFKSPFKGRALLTVETDRVTAWEWLDVNAGETSWTFKPSTFAPNAYVSAFVIKDPHLESAQSFLPDRAFGVASARMSASEFTQRVAVDVPKEVRSNGKLEVKLDFAGVEPGSFATVAVVDEGILSLTGFKSPNPFAEIFARRALGVETYETVGWTLVQPQDASKRTGGDEDEEGADAGRVQPVKPVALWSGLVAIPAGGKLTVPFDIPQYRGKLRVMAVAAGPKKMAHAAANVTVRDPLVLQTTLPRFAIDGDVMQIPVFLTNLSGKAQEVKVTLAAEPLPVPGVEVYSASVAPLQFLGKSEGTVKIEDGKSATLVFQAKAAMTLGAAKLRVVAKSAEHESREELDVPFNPNGPRERVVQRVELRAGTNDLKPLLEGWVPTTERTTVWVTSNPYGDSFDHLAYLVRYPYGCIEQTTSSTRPLLFVSQLLKNVDPTLVHAGKIEDMVMHGVNRVLTMQTPSGGFGYWIGDTHPTSWGSAYATHMLLDAQKAGYPVPQHRLDQALTWMEREVGRFEAGKASDYGDHGWDTGSEPYMHYVLALAGKGQKARVARLIETAANANDRRSAGVRDEEQYMLKAALYLAGDRRYEKDLKSPDASPILGERRNDWTYYSDRRRRGFVLSTFQDLFGNDPAGEALAQRVAEGLRGHHSGYYTTQELVWGITGLGKRVVAGSKDFQVGALMANAKKLKASSAEKGADRSWSVARASEYEKLTVEVDDPGKGSLFAIISSEGLRKNAVWKFGGNGLSISRKWRSLDGTEVNPSEGLGLADLAFVEIEIANKSGERIQNIALVDRLPAGFEIENPRLGRGAPVDWVERDHLWQADAMNVRDDRLEVFGALEARETKKVVYAVRAVTSGTFTLPPVEAEAMYDPSVWAREGGGKVEIRGSWADYLL